jgi:hypothetical protein
MTLQTNVIRSWPLGSAVSKVKKDMMTAATTIKPKKYIPNVANKISPVRPIEFPAVNLVSK